MIEISKPSEAINPGVIKPGSVIYCAGNAGTPRELLRQLAADLSIVDVDMYSVLLLGDESLQPLFSQERCQTLTHRVIFNSHLTREAVNKGWAKYHPLHLSEIPKYIRHKIKPNVALISVAGPDNGGNYVLGTTVEGVLKAVQVAKESGGVVIAERNKRMPFVLGDTIPETYIDYIYDTEYYRGPVCPGWLRDGTGFDPAVWDRPGAGGGDRCHPP